jgi:biotin carboxyl carrier protein
MLFPKEACDASKAEMRAANIKWTGTAPKQPHALREGRRVPIKALAQRLNVEQYDAPAPWSDIELKPRQVFLPLRQGAGAPNKPLVKKGDKVKAGQPLGEIAKDALGAIIHAPFAATVAEVTDSRIVLTR